MARKRHSAEEIVNKLRQAEVERGNGSSTLGFVGIDLGDTLASNGRAKWLNAGNLASTSRRSRNLSAEMSPINCSA